ncbi:MAG TPA: acyl-phosphate glycerol 3-phosphate acyltransferase, partial [Gammaproteobacteria bacterium]|nr:acyl-phosphate glycerol 3-phosphate acyltransferase [Gammaproteobacteria bacterium]
MAFEPQGKGDSDPQVALLLGVVSDLVAELRGGERLTVSLDSDLERELGLDSLARAELLSRVERVVQGRLPEDALGRVECPRDVLTLLMPVGPATRPAAQGAEAGSRSGPGIALPAEAGTLVEVLDWHARRTPERAYLHFYSGGQQLDSRSFGALHEAAGRMAGGLRAQGIGSGQTVALMLPTSVDFLAAFLGVMMAGAVPVPMYPPARRATLEDHLRRQAGILNNAQAVMLLTSEEVLPLAPLLKGLAPALRTVCRVADLPKAGAERPRIKAGDIAFLQYTSGSTGDPKGVVLSHANLLANIRAMGQAVGASPADVFVSWLPLYHDMGLIGAWLGSLYYGMNFVLMSPLAFLSRPLRWLQAIQRHGGTLSAGPNFAYELCLRRISDEELAGLDLRTWRCAFNGAEPISPVTLEAFCERFASCGFRREAMMPVYGLAECAVGLAFPPVNRGPRVDTVQRRPFSRRGRALPAGPEQTGALRFVACGRPLPGHAIRIVDPAGRECPERVEGEVEFKGPSACQG